MVSFSLILKTLKLMLNDVKLLITFTKSTHSFEWIFLVFSLSNSQITIGAPNNEVTALIGKLIALAMASHTNIKIAPQIATAGNNIL